MATNGEACQLRELNSLNASLRFVFGLALLMTFGFFSYMGVRVLVLAEHVETLDVVGLGVFGVACLALCNIQFRCIRRVRGDTREKLEEMTFVDPLTGVYNFRYLRRRLADEFDRASREGNALSVIYLDFDHFKELNDTYGHDAGNLVLERASGRILAATRGDDFAGRLGGDEFLVVMPCTDAGGALIAADRLKEKLDALSLETDDGQSLEFVTYSMGVAAYPGIATTVDELIEEADQALYRAKEQGGDRVIYADAG
jgi:diguanylate cyclase (GGDEF)-like protein